MRALPFNNCVRLAVIILSFALAGENVLATTMAWPLFKSEPVAGVLQVPSALPQDRTAFLGGFQTIPDGSTYSLIGVGFLLLGIPWTRKNRRSQAGNVRRFSNTRAARRFLALGMTLAAITVPVAASTSFQNGSFDAVGSTTGSFASTLDGGSTAALSGWSVSFSNRNLIDCVVAGGASTSGSICLGHAPATKPKFNLWAYPGASPNGGNYFLADGDTNFASPIQQTVTFNPANGLNFQIKFYQAAGEENCLLDDGVACDPPGGTLTEKWQVGFNSSGTTTQNSTVMSYAQHTAVAWQQQVMNFTLPSGSTSAILTFLSFGTPNGAPPVAMLDGISLSQTPEPGTIALLGFGLLALPLAHRWHNKRR